jgi:hypothetical protein
MIKKMKKLIRIRKLKKQEIEIFNLENNLKLVALFYKKYSRFPSIYRIDSLGFYGDCLLNHGLYVEYYDMLRFISPEMMKIVDKANLRRIIN